MLTARNANSFFFGQRVLIRVRRVVDLMKTAKVNAYIVYIIGKIEHLSIHAA